eukprot:369780-Ditylum_brightwellii.AAC.1
MDKSPQLPEWTEKQVGQEDATVESAITSHQTADLVAMESTLTAQINTVLVKMNQQMEQINTDIQNLGDDICLEMTKVIDNLTTSAITKIDNHMSAEFDTMNSNINNIVSQINQASNNTTVAFHTSMQQQYQIQSQSQGLYNQYTTNVPGTQDFIPSPTSPILDHKKHTP